MSENKNLNDDAESLESAAKSVKKTFDLYTSLVVDKKTDSNDKSTVDRENEGSINSLNLELQKSLKNINKTVDKESVNKLLVRNKEKDANLFKSDNLIDEQSSAIAKKLSKWESTKEINQANASVMAAWMNNFKTT